MLLSLLKLASHQHQLRYVLHCAVDLELLLRVVEEAAARRGYCYWLLRLLQLHAATCAFVCSE
jgi:hypothetical protein